MKTNKTTFKKELETLVSRYSKHQHEYESSKYNETDVRSEFLNKLFKSLGWDVENEEGKSPMDKDVWMERGDCQGKRPDYNFRLNNKTSFYLEAKSPSVKVDSCDSIHQAKSYSWSTTESTVSLSVLTNFKEILVFDTTMVPDYDYPERGLIFKFSFDEYSSQAAIDKLWLLSRDEMKKGTLHSSLLKDRTRDVFRVKPDDRLLDTLNDLRLKLATSLYNMNKQLDLEKIQDVVGTLINRFLFIRVMEDRGTIDRRGLKDCVDDWAEQTNRRETLLIKAIQNEFNYINENFNGKLFHGDPLDGVKIEGEVLADVILNLYGRKCPFAFNRLDTNTLGHIYEKFLSSEITVQGKKVSLVEKEVIRKSGGVFYTPKSVVEFMCKDALAPVLKKANRIEEIRVLDPSCGSGTFLLTSYRMLLDECANRMKLNRNELPFSEKRRILLSCIFGIDVDGEASKVAILSLCLLALENEEHISKGKRLLPNLHENLIKCDSLIHKDIEGRKPVQIENFPPRSKHFIILGNPPYLNVKRDFFSEQYKTHLEDLYETAVGQWDTYALFLERCKNWGPDVFSLIVPKPVLTNESQENTRKVLHNSITKITDAGAVFDDAAVEAVVLHCQKSYSKAIVTDRWSDQERIPLGLLDKTTIIEGAAFNIYASPKVEKSFEALEKTKKRLHHNLEREIERGIEKGKNALTETRGRNRYKCFAGSEINSALANTPSRYIDIDWTAKSTFKSKATFTGPKVLVRRVTNSLIASTDYSDAVCLNTLYILKPTNNLDVETLTCYINSSVMKFWFKYKYVNDDVLFPYIRKNQLEDLPLPENADKMFESIRALCHKSIHSNDDLKLVSSIDLLICKSFGLNKNDLEVMQEYMNKVFSKAA